jgi:hypothetical protein
VYHGVVLHDPNHITHVVLFAIAAALWILYLHEILFRSGRIPTRWVKQTLADLALMLLIALVTILIITFMSAVEVHRRH